MTNLIDAARTVLRANDRGGYTVPTDRLYPFQWNWDSAFVALGWATFDEDRAWREIERLLEGQWDDGMVPHIVFHVPSDDYFPGPTVWGTAHRPATSGITQPPVLANGRPPPLGSHRRTRARQTVVSEAVGLAPLVGEGARPRGQRLGGDPASMGIGHGQQPAWDAALTRVPTAATTPIRRRDTPTISMPPCGRRTRSIGATSSSSIFTATCTGSRRVVEGGALQGRRRRDQCHPASRGDRLLALANRFGKIGEEAEIGACLERRRRVIESLWNGEEGIFQSFDLIGGTPVDAVTSAGFLSLFAGLADRDQARRMAALLERWGRKVDYLVPSLSPEDSRFDAKRYWRGPVWAIVNRMIAEGLSDYGYDALAERIREDTRTLLGQGGFAEYFDPTTGAGLGGQRFSWTAATALIWAMI
jgi:hypothetical protein